LFVAIVAVGAAGYDSDIGECAVVIVLEKDAGLRIYGDVDVWPAVVIEIVGDRSDGVAAAGFKDAGFFGDVGERAVAVVAIEDVGIACEAARATHDGNAFPLAERRAVGSGFLRVELDVIADEEIEIAVAVVVEKGATEPSEFLRCEGRLVW